MTEAEIYERCDRCRWWGDKARETYGRRPCYAHSVDKTGWHLTSYEERCPSFKALHGGEGLQPDVCPGCRGVSTHLSTIEEQVDHLWKVAFDSLSPRDLEKTAERVRTLADTIRYGPRKVPPKGATS